MNHCLGAGPLGIFSTHTWLFYHSCARTSIVSWGNFGHLRALFLFWSSNRFGMGFGWPRSYNKRFYNNNIPNRRHRPKIKFEGATPNPMETKFGASSVPRPRGKFGHPSKHHLQPSLDVLAPLGFKSVYPI